MSGLDWAVLVGTILTIVGYGMFRERGISSSERYMRGGSDQKWFAIGLSVMATQASAITFLSMPGQAYEDGMGFLQFYFGLPIAMVLLSALVVPIYHRLKVYTAYEYLEQRFDRKTRQLTAGLFLLSRGLAAGISIYAPAIVLSSVLKWPLRLTVFAIGGLVILYTVSGGTRAVGRTQIYQMVVMLGGMGAAFVFLWRQLPMHLSLNEALAVGGALKKTQIVDYSTHLGTRYTLWSGLLGGLFVALAYFGTDQSQVQRYLSGASLTESRLGLLFNGLVKLPMQFVILLVGVLLFVFHQFGPAPIFFNTGEWAKVKEGAHAEEARRLDHEWEAAAGERQKRAEALVHELRGDDIGRTERAKEALRASAAKSEALRTQAKALVASSRPGAFGKDADYIFIDFVLAHFPAGLIGLLLAVILCAAMSATAAALSSLGSTTVVDFYRPSLRPTASDGELLRAAKVATVLWGGLAIAFAAFASQIDNLIQAVNILGSIFYGPMLGVFLVGLFLARVRATPVFYSILLGQALVVAAFAFSSIGFLWYNVIGCVAVVLSALGLNVLFPQTRASA